MTNTKPKELAKVTPAKALVRFQFVDALIRIALKRYFESKVVNTKLEAIQMLIKEHLNPFYEKI
jgi:hypothetical protein